MKKTLDDEDRRYLVRSYETKVLEALEDARDLLERDRGCPHGCPTRPRTTLQRRFLSVEEFLCLERIGA